MSLTSASITQTVIRWIDQHEYSRNHWNDVSLEMLEKANNDLEIAITYLAEALERFHSLYVKKVVQTDNLLFDLLTQCFDLVDWTHIARSRYPNTDN